MVLVQRKFVRLSDDDKNATYHVFRQWLGKDRTITEDEWLAIMEEDKTFDYANLGVGREHPAAEIPQAVETEVITGGTSDIEDNENDSSY